jgi:hypothetical protein
LGFIQFVEMVAVQAAGAIRAKLSMTAVAKPVIVATGRVALGSGTILPRKTIM